MSTVLPGQRVSSAAAIRSKSHWKRRTMIVSRWLHIYISMASFAIVFFFAITGLTLNHADWFASQQRAVQTRGVIDVKLLSKSVAKLEIVEYFRNRYHLHGAVKDFRIEDTSCSLSFKAPGYAADVFLDRGSGRFELTETKMGFVAVVNDLHKGRDAGDAWSWIIDISAVLMTLVSVTGLLLIFFLQKKRLSGLLVLAAGASLVYLVYLAWVG